MCFDFCADDDGCVLQQVEYSIIRVQQSLPRLYQLAQGGTAVGTGLNSFEGFDEQIAAEVMCIHTHIPVVCRKVLAMSYCAADAKHFCLSVQV